MSATLAPSSRLADHRLFRVVAVFLVSLLFPFHAFAGQATLAWDANTDSRVTGYNIHYGAQSGTYTSTYSAGTTTSATVSGLTEGQTYYFVVRARDAAGTESANSNQVSTTIPSAAPVASITAVPTSGTAPLAVAFTSTVTGATSYTWNFGNNVVSANVQNPSYTYTAPGTYTASLSATGPGGTVVQSKTITVTASTGTGGSTGTTNQAPESIILSPSADVTVAPGTRIQFTGSGNSSNLPLTYSWNYGDGGSSTRQNPRHSYGTAGTYIAKLTVKDAKGIADPTPAAITVTVGTPTPTPTPTPTATTQTLWPATAIPTNPSESDSAAVNLGVKFTSSQNGLISGIRFYKSTANSGTHVGTLWSSTGQKLATVTFTNETASGWQQVNFATPVAITVNTVYVASYFAPNGHYANDDNYFASTGINSGSLHALSKPESGGNGVYAYGSTSAFPSKGYQATNYWVDVVFAPVQ